MNNQKTTHIESLHRDFESGRLMAVGEHNDGWRRSKAFWVIQEPISDYFKKFIGDMPIPPKLGKVDL